MERRKLYWDVALVTLALLSSLMYHVWLWYTVKTNPSRTYFSMNSLGQRAWVDHMIKDNDKRNVLAVQTIRNNIMGATLMATASILICCGLLTFAGKTYGSDKPNDPFALVGNGELKVDSKCAALLLCFLAVFLCQSLSIMCLTQVNVLINILALESSPATKDRVIELLEKGIFLCTVGNRLFFTAIPLVLWIFGPVLVFVCSIGIVAVLYSVDVVCGERKGVAAVEEARISDSASLPL